jgi:DNA-binding LytR/AlgR family response regulator
MKIYNCVIVDDEKYAIAWLSEYVNSLPFLRLLHVFENAEAALSFIAVTDDIDLVLLDIKMPGISGIELSYRVRNKAKKLVFSTSHKRFAYEAFEAQADGYLLKPYSLKKFQETMHSLFLTDADQYKKLSEDEYFFAKNKNDGLKHVKIFIKDIVAVESKQNYVMIHTLSIQILTHISLSQISDLLLKYDNFAQFQRSFIISKLHIESIHGNTLIMTGGRLKITVGNYYRKEFSTFLANKIFKSRT